MKATCVKARFSKLVRSLSVLCWAIWAIGPQPSAQAQTTATATATVLDGGVTAITVTDGGSGYAEPPVVTLVGGEGSGATAEALVTNGVVTQINVLTPGSGYTTPCLGC